MKKTKTPKSKKSLKKLFIYSKKYLVFIVIGILISVVGAILGLMGPDKFKDLTDEIVVGIKNNTLIDLDKVLSLGSILVIFYSISFLFSVFQGQLLVIITQKISYKLRKDVKKKVNKLEVEYFNKAYTGDILSKITNDVSTLSRTLAASLSSLITSTVLILSCLVMMFITNYIMALVALVSSLFGFFLMGLIMKKSQKHFKKRQDDIAKINSNIEETYLGHDTIMQYNAAEHYKQKFNKLNNNLRKSVYKSESQSGLMMPLMMFIGNFGYVLVSVVGAILVKKNLITIGVIVAFMIYVRLFTNPLSQIAQSFQGLQAGAAASKKVFDFLELEELPEESDLIDVKSSQENISFENVYFKYPTSKNYVIEDFSIKCNKGEKIAIVGPTGAGKTTIINLILRFYEIDKGDILIGGNKLSTIKKSSIRNLFSMVLQEGWIFEGSFYENLVFSSKNITLEEVKRATSEVGLNHYIESLSNGYDTILKKEVELSEGQLQQLTIARAILAKKPMLILDEATSSVDTRTELKIQEAMDTLMKDKTSFIIAHRLSTIKNADKIIVMNKGSIVEVGKHEELLNNKKFYYNLYMSQFENK